MKNNSGGKILEAAVAAAAIRAGYAVTEQVGLSPRPHGGGHRVDAVLQKEGAIIAVSSKFQGGDGTCDEKIPYEVISLANACALGECSKAYIVLCGDGWQPEKKKWLTNQSCMTWIPLAAGKVFVIAFDEYIRLLAEGNL